MGQCFDSMESMEFHSNEGYHHSRGYHNNHHRVAHHHQYGNSRMQNSRNGQQCFRCQGRGFNHTSIATHNRPTEHQRCPFCSNCSSCQGTGITSRMITGNYNNDISIGLHSHRINGYHDVSSTMQHGCHRCKGYGYYHDSNMDHDAPPNDKCFFCTDCKHCDAKNIRRHNFHSRRISRSW